MLSSDFLVDFEDPSHPAVALQAKYSVDLEKPEIIERLELERRYWEEKEISWAVVTEREISRTAFTNIQWLYPAQADENIVLNDLERYYSLFLYEFQRHPDQTLTNIVQNLDVAYELEPGLALYWLRQLLARHYFLFDINTLYRELKPGDLSSNPHQEQQEIRHAPG